MGRAVPSSSNKGAFLAAIGASLLVACAASAPALPPDTTSVNSGKTLTLEDFGASDKALTCEQIGSERQQIADAMQAANGRIEANRTQNQVAGYFGALFLVPYVAPEGTYAAKDQVTKLYARQDTLIKLAGVKRCPAAS
jgi:hypothetical protein